MANSEFLGTSMCKEAKRLYIRPQQLLGHADLQMATRYVQDVSKQTDKVVNASRDFFMNKGGDIESH